MLTTFAVSQPLLSLISANTTFLIAHNMAGWQVVAYAAALVVVPWMAITLGEEVAIAVVPRARSVVWVTLRAVLLGVAVAAPLNRALGLDGWPAVALIVVMIGVAATALRQLSVMRRLLRVGLFAPVAFLGLFVWASPASDLIMPEQVVGAEVAADHTPVVWLLFDNFPRSMLVDGQGEIRDNWFPNFSRLEDMSTWYSSATTVASHTSMAVPPSLTGRLTDPRTPAVADNHPQNLFTLLSGSHDVVAMENFTKLCPEVVCESTGRVDPRALAIDTGTLLVRTVTPPAVANRLVPQIGTQWAFFGEADNAATGGDDGPVRHEGDDRDRVATFMGHLEELESNSLLYMHLERPHAPLLYVPDGRKYEGCFCHYFLNDELLWPDDPVMLHDQVQRYLLQAMSVDTILGQVLDELAANGQLDETMLVVMSDHGSSLLPDTYRRKLTPNNENDVLPVPMFIKYPGTREPVRDERPAQIIDLLPTVLEVLRADAPDDLDGVSLVSPTTSLGEAWTITYDGTSPMDRVPEATDSDLIPFMDDLFPNPENPYALAPNAELMGVDPEPLLGDSASLEARITTMPGLADVDLAADEVPAHVIGELEGADESVELVAALNGRIAGMGATYRKESWQITLMLDPTALVEGSNDLELYAVEGKTLRPIAITAVDSPE